MTDVHTKKQRSYNMSKIKSKNTKYEIILRKKLWAEGIRNYRLHKKLPGTPDITFTNSKLVIFVDGCFWHKCPKCFKKPSTNINFWNKKINSNVERDKKVNRILKENGWKVLRFWEHDIKKDVNRCIRTIKSNLKIR